MCIKEKGISIMEYTKKIKNGQVYYRWRDVKSGVCVKELIAKTTKDLDKKVLDYQVKVQTGQVLGSPNVTVETWAWEWLETYKKGNVIQKSYNLYKSNLNKYILPIIGKQRVSDIKNIDLQRILNMQEGKSFTHISHLKDTMTSMFFQAQKNEIIIKNPAISLSIPKNAVKGTHRSLSPEEEKLMLSLAESHRHGVWILCMYYCGLRVGELAALKVKDIDINKKTIYIRRAFESATTKEKETKTKAGERIVPVPDVFMGIINKHIENKNADEYVFTTSKNSPITTTQFDKYFNTFKRDMDIKSGAVVENNKIVSSVWNDYWKTNPLTPYCLRHTYCTNLQKVGIPLNVAKYLMGHSSIKMTAEIYTHQTEDQTELARDLMNAKKGD